MSQFDRPDSPESKAALMSHWLEILRSSYALKKKEIGDALAPREVSHLPERARRDLDAYRGKLARLVGGVADQEQTAIIDELMLLHEGAFAMTYSELRFDVGNERLLNEHYAKDKVVDWIREAMEKGLEEKGLERIATLSFDANGLKSVNDNAGHDNGTKYLKSIAEALHNRDGALAAAVKRFNLEAELVSAGGGDEFFLIVRSGQSIAPETLTELMKAAENDLRTVQTQEALDFSDEATVLRFGGLKQEAIAALSRSERSAKAAEIRAKNQIPDGYRMPATASAGAANLRDGLLSAIVDPRAGKRVSDSDDFFRLAQKIMGGMWDSADRMGQDNKKKFKENLKNSGDSQDRFLSLLLHRSGEARDLEQRLDESEKRARFHEVARRSRLAVTKSFKNGEIAAEQAMGLVSAIDEELEQRLGPVAEGE